MTRFPALAAEQRARLLAAPDPGGPPVDVVLDTDVMNEVDDQFAIVWALLRPDRLRVRALLACPWAHQPPAERGPGYVAALDARQVERAAVGPAEGVARAEAELHRINALLGTDAPVLAGAPRYLPDAGTPVDSLAARALVDLAHDRDVESDGPLYVVAIGCATNVASALLLDPGIVDRVVVTWTAAYPSFWPYPNASFNLAQDVPAARVLLDSGVPFVYLPGYYVGEELRVSRPDLDRHVREAGPVGDYLWRTVVEHPLYSLAEPGSSKVMWDLVNVAWLVDPAWLTTGLVPTPGLDDELRWTAPAAGRHLMLEATDIDRDAVIGDLYRVLGGATKAATHST